MGPTGHSRRLVVVVGGIDCVMRVRLDYGTEGLDVDLPDERITVIEPIPQGRGRGPACDAAQRDAGSARSPAARRARANRAAGRHLRVRHHAGAAAARHAARALRGDAAGPARRRHHPDRHRHASHQHAARARADAWPRHPEPISRHQPRFAGSLVAGTRGRDVHGSRSLPEHGVARRRRAHHDGLRRTAFLRRIQRRAEDDGSRAGRA